MRSYRSPCPANGTERGPSTGLAGVLAARDRLAAVAVGDGLLLLTHAITGSVTTAEHATDLLCRAAQVRMVLSYALGVRVTHADRVPRGGSAPTGLLADVAAAAPPRDRVALVDEVVADAPDSKALAAFALAAKFGRAFGVGADTDQILVCAHAGQPSAVDGLPPYDPAAHLLAVGRGTHVQDAGLASLANPLVVDFPRGLAGDGFVAVCSRLNPHRLRGRLVLRLRGTAEAIGAILDAAGPLVRRAGHEVVWLADPGAGDLAPQQLAALLTRAGPRPTGVGLTAITRSPDPLAQHRSLLTLALRLFDALGPVPAR